MPTDIGWRQSKEVRTNFMSLLNDTVKEVKKLTKLQHELLQKQLVEAGAINVSNTDVKVNTFSIYEKQAEIEECESNMQQHLYSMKVAILDDSDLVFMNIKEIEHEINNCKSDIENCMNEVDEIRGEMEE